MSRAARFALVALAALALTAALGWTRRAEAGGGLRRAEGPPVAVGGGTARLYAEFDAAGAPTAVGVALSEGALTGLAPRMNQTSRCFDKDGDGRHAHGECLGDYEVTLELPAEARGLGLPVRWAMVNWNPEGHMHPAPAVWSAPHFDFHFYVADRAQVYGIRPGPCGELIDCDDHARAAKPVPERYLPEGYIDVGAAVPAMGNHLVDSRDPEIADPSRGFSRTFIYGSYDGQLIFFEPMVSHAWLASRPDECTALRVAREVATTGWYPTRYCVRHDAGSGTYRVALEGLVHRDAS